MALFAVIGLGDTSALGEAIKQRFPDDHYLLEAGKWFVAANGETARTLSEKLNLIRGSSSLGIIVNASGGYYGLAPADVWEWVTAKLTSVTTHA